MTTSTQDKTLTMLQERWQQNAEKLERTVAEIPADKFSWQPADTVRTVAEVLRHVAYWNRYLAAVLRGEQADDTGNELPAADYPTKAKVLAALRASSREVSTALEKLNGNRTDPATASIVAFGEHNAEHYGQLAVYCRLLGIVPPASRT